MIVSVQLLKEFDHKKLKSTKKEGLDLGEEDDKKKPEEPKSEFEPLTKLMKDVFGDKVEKATASGRILASPCFLTWEYGLVRRGPDTLDHDRVEEEGVGREVPQDGEGGFGLRHYCS